MFVDCGLSFPEDDMYGIDLVIPDITYLKDNIDKVRGFFITHGHEDHIGAIPYVLREINVPIYSTKLTNGIIEHKLREHNMLTKVKRKVVKYGQHINLRLLPCGIHQDEPQYSGCGGACHLLPAGIIVHTGDFKVDYTPVFGDAIDLQRFGEIGRKGVLALMCDSTNAERQDLPCRRRRSARHLMRFSRTTRITGSSLRLLHPMSTVCSRSSIRRIRTAAKWWSRDEAWSTSSELLPNLDISVFRTIR